MKSKFKKAVEAINRNRILLVYPIDNRPEPASLWSKFYPGKEMRWEWDENGDDRVGELWRLREELSRSGEVIYAKWFRGRATFFSKAMFIDLLAVFETTKKSPRELGLGEEARLILETLVSDSPLSTKQLKLATELRGKIFERTYEKAMKSLWERLAIVGFGEIDDGAFPSLAVGATQSLFEGLWDDSKSRDRSEALGRIEAGLGTKSLFYRQLFKGLNAKDRV